MYNSLDYQDFSEAFIELFGQLPKELSNTEKMTHYHDLNKEAFTLLSKIKGYYEDKLPDHENK